MHALDVDALDRPSVRFWTAREEHDASLLGVGALLIQPDRTGEIKSMRVAGDRRGRGVGTAVLTAIVADAAAAGLTALQLETGTGAAFASARRLYARHGFAERGPFGAYREDPHSAFFELRLPAGEAPAGARLVIPET
ncbi:GNAT family N-acetyltransferase [Leucobacter allii]|uniref:GNAT family N-acetyltransferase n=1 Tax=Leucobacter allii TaxID=2932247 RepID=UPI003211BB0E